MPLRMTAQQLVEDARNTLKNRDEYTTRAMVEAENIVIVADYYEKQMQDLR